MRETRRAEACAASSAWNADTYLGKVASWRAGGVPSRRSLAFKGQKQAPRVSWGRPPSQQRVTVLSAGPGLTWSPWRGRGSPAPAQTWQRERFWPLVPLPLLSQGAGRAPQASQEGGPLSLPCASEGVSHEGVEGQTVQLPLP